MSDEEMFRTFNMGIGMVIVVSPEEVCSPLNMVGTRLIA